MSRSPKSALTFIFITILIDCTGFGVIIPVTPSLIEELIGGNLSQASVYGAWLTISYAAMQFIFSPILGGLSDRYGRRPILLASLFGLGIDYLFLAFAPTIWWLFLGRMIAGVCGASFTTAAAYIADVSTPDKRAQNFGLVGAAFGIGFIVGPVIGGFFSHYGIRVPFMVAAVLALLNWLYGYFILPESLNLRKRRRLDFKRANPFGSLMQLKQYKGISGLIVATILLYIAGHALQSTWTYITMEKFSWNEAWVGYSLGAFGIGIGLVQGGLIRVIIPKIGQKNAVYTGLSLYFLGFILFAFASQSWMMFAIMIPYSLGGIAGPAIQGIMSNHVPDNAQGELQGAITSLISLTSIVGPLLMNNLFAYYTKQNNNIYFPGAPFLMGGLLIMVSLVFAYRSLVGRKTP